VKRSKSSAPAPTTLGSLSLYGELLPEKGAAGIPPAAKQTCAELRKVLANVRELKQNPGSKVDRIVSPEYR